MRRKWKVGEVFHCHLTMPGGSSLGEVLAVVVSVDPLGSPHAYCIYPDGLLIERHILEQDILPRKVTPADKEMALESATNHFNANLAQKLGLKTAKQTAAA